MKRLLPGLLILIVIAVLAMVVFSFALPPPSPSGQDPSPSVSRGAGLVGPEMTIHFIDVGQADAILIDFGEYEAVIDAGNNRDGEAVAAYLEPYVDGPLDLVIGTHPDADHIGGLDDVI
ncbi:MAG: MBL fold metallo-hydrolase, partial [Bacillota bacterium]|nr:MBL fold metallo-hydrolase [Bacillota bacterium]